MILGIPVLQMRGDYLAIVTLGFGEIIRLIFLSDWLKPLVRRLQRHHTHPQGDQGRPTEDFPTSRCCST